MLGEYVQYFSPHCRVESYLVPSLRTYGKYSSNGALLEMSHLLSYIDQLQHLSKLPLLALVEARGKHLMAADRWMTDGD